MNEEDEKDLKEQLEVLTEKQDHIEKDESLDGKNEKMPKGSISNSYKALKFRVSKYPEM